MSWFFGGSDSGYSGGRTRTPIGQAPLPITGSAVTRGTPQDPSTVLGGNQPPDASLAAQQAAIAAQAAHDKARKKASAGSGATVLTGLPGSSTAKPLLYQRTLMGS